MRLFKKPWMGSRGKETLSPLNGAEEIYCGPRYPGLKTLGYFLSPLAGNAVKDFSRGDFVFERVELPFVVGGDLGELWVA